MVRTAEILGTLLMLLGFIYGFFLFLSPVAYHELMTLIQ